jgi:hypothetical protein
MFDQVSFKTRIMVALDNARNVLETNKSPVLLESVDHTYDDKYTVVEGLGTLTIAGIKNALSTWGFSKEKLDTTRNIVVKCKIEQDCTFVEKKTKQVPTGSQVIERTGIFKDSKKIETYMSVEEYKWTHNVSVHVYLVYGDAMHVKISDIFPKTQVTDELRTNSEINPKEHTPKLEEFTCNITHLFHLDAFTINRKDEKCYTPKNNENCKELLELVQNLGSFCMEVRNRLSAAIPKLLLLDTNEALLPVPVLDLDEKSIIAQHILGLKRLINNINASDSSQRDISQLEFILKHLFDIGQAFYDGLAYIESLIYDALIAAIGKAISSKDLTDYMVFHNRKLFKEEYSMRNLSIEVRRQGYTPEGVLSFESTDNNNIIYTMQKRIDNPVPIKVKLNGASSVSINGPHYIHGYISHSFSNERNSKTLIARARQFSSFILMIGTIVSDDLFDCQHAIIVQNNDSVMIPLLFDPLPSAVQFRDAIASLSAEQQAFCRAFRAMQLSSTMFAVCVVQIKPLLERVLNLDPGSLTKEVKLSLDLMKLFIEYQIPSDLMKFDGRNEESREQKLTQVRLSTNAVKEIIEECKKNEFDERERVAKIQKLEEEAKPVYLPKKATFRSFTAVPAPVSAMAVSQAAMFYSPATSVEPPGAVYDDQVLQEEAMEPEPEPLNELEGMEQNTTEASRETNFSMSGYTSLPKRLDEAFENLKTFSSIKQTIIKVEGNYTRTRMKGLIGTAEKQGLMKEEQKGEMNRAFDLLDALSRSGEIPLEYSELHIVLGVTQCFDETLMNTIIKKNINPISEIEQTTLIMASIIHGKDKAEFIK